MKAQTPIEYILDNMDFTNNEHILKNADKLKQQEKDFWRKELKNSKEVKPIDRLRQQYKKATTPTNNIFDFSRIEYDTMRLFCLDCSLLSFAEIEMMEYEVNENFNTI